MTTKLTLSVDARIVAKAKRYAKKRGKSVSKIFEDHIEELTQEKDGQNSDPLQSLKKLRGIAKGAIPDHINYKDAVADIMMEKYR